MIRLIFTVIVSTLIAVSAAAGTRTVPKVDLNRLEISGTYTKSQVTGMSEAQFAGETGSVKLSSQVAQNDKDVQRENPLPEEKTVEQNKDTNQFQKGRKWTEWVVFGIVMLILHYFRVALWVGISAAVVGLLILLPVPWGNFEFTIPLFGKDFVFSVSSVNGDNQMSLELQVLICLVLSSFLIGAFGRSANKQDSLEEKSIQRPTEESNRMSGENSRSMRGIVVNWSEGKGSVKFLKPYGDSDLWQASSKENIGLGDTVKVTGVDMEQKIVTISKELGTEQ